MGALLGLLLGLGLLLVWRSGPRRPPPLRRSRPGWQARTSDLLAQAGIEGVTPRQLVGASAGLAVTASVVVLGTSQVPLIAVLFGGFAGVLPLLLVRRRRAQRTLELREVWPEAVDNLASGVRAPTACAAIGVPAPRPAHPELRQPPTGRCCGSPGCRPSR